MHTAQRSFLLRLYMYRLKEIEIQRVCEYLSIIGNTCVLRSTTPTQQNILSFKIFLLTYLKIQYVNTCWFDKKFNYF